MGYLATQRLGSLEPDVYDVDAMGRIDQLTRGDGDTTTLQDDVFGRTTSFTTDFGGAGATYLSSYDRPSGNESGSAAPTTVTDPRGTTRHYVYDDFGRLVRSSSADFGTQRWGYEDGRLVETILPEGKRTLLSYDGLSRVTGVDNDADNPGVVGQDYAYHYDNGDSTIACPISLPFSGDACEYRVGSLAKVDIEVAPGVFDSLYLDYAADGQTRAERWEGGRSTFYEHHPDGRLKRLWYPDGSDAAAFYYSAVANDHLGLREAETMEYEQGGGTVFQWAKDMQREPLGRLTSARLADNSDTFPGFEASYNSAGLITTLKHTRSDGGSPTSVVERSYDYADDGMIRGFSSSVENPRHYLYDEGNRIRCATTSSVSNCPTGGSSLVQSYDYDLAGNLTARGGRDGAHDFTHSGNSLFEEQLPSGNLAEYAYTLGPGGARAWDEEFSGQPNRREYTYDGIGRLRTVLVQTPFDSEAFEEKLITILYDHRSRPYIVSSEGLATGELKTTEYTWALSDLLLTRRVTSENLPIPVEFTEHYFHIDPSLIGVTRYDAVSSKTHHFYDARDQVGLPIARWEFDGPNATNVVWSAEHTPFGRRVKEEGDAAFAPAWGFFGQVLLEDSAATVHDGVESTVIRDPLYLNQWRVYDPYVGQYLTPEPLALKARRPYTPSHLYVDGNPVNAVDPNGADAIFINFPAYQITVAEGTRLPLGHAGVVAVDPSSGLTRYYEYGRYPGDPTHPKEFGRVRRRIIPNVTIGPDGRPTEESLEQLFAFLSERFGQEGAIRATYYNDVSYDDVVSYAEDRRTDSERAGYNIATNSCYDFARSAISESREAWFSSLRTFWAPIDYHYVPGSGLRGPWLVW